MACCKGAGEGGRLRSGVAPLPAAFHPEVGRMDEGEREGGAQRSSGLEKVGVSDCHGHTNTQEQILRTENGHRLD